MTPCLYELALLEIMLLLRGAAEVVTPPPSESPISGEAMGRVKIYPNADVLIEADKIVAVGSNLESPSAKVIDLSLIHI